MSSSREISSTEKLLALIRQDATETPPTMPEPEPEPAREHPSITASRKRSRKKALRAPVIARRSVAVGVDLGANAIRMVKVARHSDKHWRLVSYNTWPVRLGLSREDPAYVAVLKAALDEMRDAKNTEVWAAISSLYVDIRNIRIPKVARSQISSAAYWGLKKEATFDEAQSVFDFELTGEVVEDGVARYAVTAYAAARHEVEQTRDLFERAGHPLTGITTAPFGTQNLFRSSWMPTPDSGSVAVLYVGDERSRIDVFDGRDLVVTRGIKAGIMSMVESLVEGFQEQWRVTSSELPLDMFEDDFGEEDADEILELEVGEDGMELVPKDADSPRLESSSLDIEQARALFYSVTGEGPPLASYENVPNLSDRDVFTLMLPAVERLVRQLERTLAHHSGGLGYERVATIYVAGAVTAYPYFLKYISDQLGIECKPIDPLDPNLAFASDIPPPSAPGERADYSLALCAALSTNERTPNLLYTYENKEVDRAVSRINLGIFTGFIACVVVALGLFLWQNGKVAEKQAEKQRLDRIYTSYEKLLDQADITALSQAVVARNRTVAEAGERYLPVALVKELAAVTPASVRLLSVTADFAPAKGKDDDKKPARANLVVEGIIPGDKAISEAALASYLWRLSASPVFASPTVQRNEAVAYPGEGQVLHFFLNVRAA
ncbi:MAG: hypothetical protein ACLFOY_12330 [Desulfatibacillaceae bacterium]